MYLIFSTKHLNIRFLENPLSLGKRQDAYDLLAPVYEWFTEGFDTADLQEAKRLLEELT